jgi:hypothetical protein
VAALRLRLRLRCCAAAMNADDSMMPSDYEDGEAPAAMKQCSKRKGASNQCKRMFTADDPRKFCPFCRGVAIKHNNKRRSDPEKVKIMLEQNRKSDAKRYEQKREVMKRWKRTPAGKASVKKQNAKPLHQLSARLYKMAMGGGTRSLIRMGCFDSNDHVKAHFESTMDKTWMTWQNHGRHLTGNDYKVAWQFGHKLPVAIFDQCNANDWRKCFMPMNLFAQDAKENNELKDRLVYSDIELEALRPCWPDAAMNSLVLLKALFAGAAARAVAEGSSDDETYLEEEAMAAEDSEEADSGAETEEEAPAAGSAAAGSAAGSAAAATAAG